MLNITLTRLQGAQAQAAPRAGRGGAAGAWRGGGRQAPGGRRCFSPSLEDTVSLGLSESSTGRERDLEELVVGARAAHDVPLRLPRRPHPPNIPIPIKHHPMHSGSSAATGAGAQGRKGARRQGGKGARGKAAGRRRRAGSPYRGKVARATQAQGAERAARRRRTRTECVSIGAARRRWMRRGGEG